MAACYFLVSHSISFVSEVSYADSPVRTPASSTYVTAIHDYLSVHPLEDFSFSINNKQLSDYVSSKHQEVQTVGLSPDGTHFVVTLKKPLLVWKTDTGTFYIDGSGSAFTTNAYAEPVLSVVDNSGIHTNNIGAVASGQFIQFLGQLVAAVNALGLGEVTQVSIPPNTIKELDLHLAGRPYLVKTNVDSDPLQVAEDIKNTIHYLEGQGITPQYIDNRVDGKAFYR